MTHIIKGTKLIKPNGKIVTVEKIGFADGTKEIVYCLSDSTIVFDDDLGKDIKVIEEL
jgi:hypothetical protein